MFRFIRKRFIRLLTGIGNAFNHTKCESLCNQKCMTQSNLANYILMDTVKNFTTIHLRLN